MSEKITRPYTAIADFLDRTPQDLTSPGREMAHSPLVTAAVRTITGFAISELLTDQTDIDRYHDAGAVLVAPSHRSFLDLTAMSYLGMASGEGQPYFMSKRENMDNLAAAWLFGKMRTFPIDRDMTDPRWATALFSWARFAMGDDIVAGQQNSKLVLFPEGTRRKGDIIEDLLPGAALVAARLRKHVLPVGIFGAEGGMSSGLAQMYIAVGEPFKVGPRDTDLIAAKIQEQYDRAKYTLEEIHAHRS
jgi:1-acyl-sn-glycerol-3-phosphate acyltransferase